jgi:hypothetical protein
VEGFSCRDFLCASPGRSVGIEIIKKETIQFNYLKSRGSRHTRRVLSWGHVTMELERTSKEEKT